jgi:hypothetical protein
MGLTGIVRLRKSGRIKPMYSDAARSFAVSLALCAMVLRALLPDGWMPAASAAVPLVICSIDGTHHTKAPGAPTQPQSHAPCAFAAAAPLAPPSPPVTIANAIDDATALAPSVRDSRFFDAPDYQPNAARAPPSHV